MMNVKTTCPSCAENVEIDVQSSRRAEYVACPKCNVRWLWEPIDDDLWDEKLDGAIEEARDGGGKSRKIIKGDYVAIYATTSKPVIGGVLLIVSGIILIITAVLLSGIVNDEVKLNGYTNGIERAFDSMGMSEEEVEYVDEEFTKSILNIIYGLISKQTYKFGFVFYFTQRIHYILCLVMCNFPFHTFNKNHS